MSGMVATTAGGQKPAQIRCCYCQRFFSVYVLVDKRVNCSHCDGLHLRCRRCLRFRPPRSSNPAAPKGEFSKQHNGQWCYDCNNLTRRGRTKLEYYASHQLCAELIKLFRWAEEDGLLDAATPEFRKQQERLFQAATNHRSIPFDESGDEGEIA